MVVWILNKHPWLQARRNRRMEERVEYRVGYRTAHGTHAWFPWMVYEDAVAKYMALKQNLKPGVTDLRIMRRAIEDVTEDIERTKEAR
jgi:hypothetical protein